MTKAYTTLNKIRSFEPCKDGWEKLLKSLNKTKADDEPLALVDILKSNNAMDAAWCLRTLDESFKNDIVSFSCDCAESVLHIFEDKYPDDKRPREAIEAVRAYVRGDITLEDLRIVCDSASAAYWAARSAYDAARAAYDAARAAYDAAYNAAYDAAYDAARVAYNAARATDNAARAAYNAARVAYNAARATDNAARAAYARAAYNAAAKAAYARAAYNAAAKAAYNAAYASAYAAYAAYAAAYATSAYTKTIKELLIKYFG